MDTSVTAARARGVMASGGAKRSWLGAAVWCVLAACGAAVGQPVLVNMGTLPGGSYSYGQAISDNGSVVAGQAVAADGRYHAIRWTSAGLVDLGVLPGGIDSGATAMSADGSVIGGWSGVADTLRAVRWTATDGLQPLSPSQGENFSYVRGMSADGSVITGSVNLDGSGQRPFRWTATSGFQTLSTPLGSVYGVGTQSSGDGSLVTGWFGSTSYIQSFAWTPNEEPRLLGPTPDGTSFYAEGVSHDGRVIVGRGSVFSGPALRWTALDGVVVLGDFDAYVVSGDGSVIGGSRFTYDGYRAVLWRSDLGAVDLNDYFGGLGVDLTGWVLEDIRAISADGRSMTGGGLYNGQIRGWVVTGVPSPGAAAVLALAGVGGLRRRRPVAG